MTATVVGMDWGMAALGITVTPREDREIVVRQGSLTTRYGEHAAISNISDDRQRDLVRLLEPPGSATSSAAVSLRLRRSFLPATADPLPSPDDASRTEIIRSIHGVTPSGNWFLLADAGGTDPSSDRLSRARNDSYDTAGSDSWLVVVGHRVRDMISADTLDPAPAPAR